MSNLKNKTIEFHILHSFPVNCLNRGENNELKTAVIGGSVRQRISSQCWKRAIREYLLKNDPCAKRVVSSQLVELIREKLVNSKCPQEKIESIIKEIHLCYGEMKDDKLLMFISPNEIEYIILKYKENKWKSLGKTENIVRIISEFTNYENDLALFGRMIAASSTLEVEGATSFNHPYTIHKIEVDQDFYTAHSDNQIEIHQNDKSSINMGNSDFSSGTFYKYFSINLNTLLQNKNNNIDEIKNILNWNYLKNFVIAVPSAHDNDKNANTRPDYIKLVIRDDQPQQVSFQTPIRLRNQDETYIDLGKKIINEQINDWKTDSLVTSDKIGDFDKILNGLFE